MLYFTSDTDDYRCIYARRINPRTGHPMGDRMKIKHMHEARRSMLSVELRYCEISVAKDKIVFVLEASTGNVWLAVLSSARADR